VVAEPQALITLIDPDNNEVVAENPIAANKRSIIYSELDPGLYIVTAKLDGYLPARSEATVLKGKPSDVNLNLTPITHDVTIKVNAPSTVMYKQGNDAPRTYEVRDGRVVLPDLRPGRYDVMIEPDDVAYEPHTATIEVTAETTFEFKLKNRLTPGEFSGSTAGAWELPSGWQFTSGILKTSGPGLALPRDRGKRFYKDFQLSTAVKLVNGVAASFALRTQEDQRNYYLIQLTGKEADESYVLRGFIVKDGVAQPFGQPAPINAFAGNLKPDSFAHLKLTMKENVIKVEIADDTGEDLIAGNLVDPNGTYQIGAVGVVVRKDEQMHVEQFIVSPKN